MSRASSPQPAKPQQKEQRADPGEKQLQWSGGAGSRPLTSSWIQSLRLHCGAEAALPLPGKGSKHAPDLHRERARSCRERNPPREKGSLGRGNLPTKPPPAPHGLRQLSPESQQSPALQGWGAANPEPLSDTGGQKPLTPAERSVPRFPHRPLLRVAAPPAQNPLPKTQTHSPHTLCDPGEPQRLHSPHPPSVHAPIHPPPHGSDAACFLLMGVTIYNLWRNATTQKNKINAPP